MGARLRANPPPPAFDRDRLVKLAGLLGSAHDGEALDAAR